MTRTATTVVLDDLTGAEVERQEEKRYTLAELKALDGPGYDRALEKLAEWNSEWGWWEMTLDSEVDHIAEKYGITYNPANVSFDLDRGSFFTFGKTTDVDARKVLRRAGVDLRTREARDIIGSGLVLGVRHGGYGMDRGWIGAYAYECMPDYVSDETAEAIEQVLRDAESEMLKILRDEQEYQTSEEALTEMAEANDYYFTAAGKVV